MSTPFNHIGLIGRRHGKQNSQTLRALSIMLKKRGLDLCIEEETAELLADNDLPVVTDEEMAKQCDLMIVVGGDGSLLGAARMAVEHDTPVLGINRGTLGFLTDILPTELIKIGYVLDGHYREEPRFLLNTRCKHNNTVTYNANALNDVVLTPGASGKMVEFEIYVDDEFVQCQRADGLIVATPTGSTAYALSGGGPILHPQLHAIVLVPMFPHTLSSRPIVVSYDSKIKLMITDNNEHNPQVSFDNQSRAEVPAGDRVIINRYEKSLRLIHPLDYNYYETLRSKLGWG